MRHLRCIHAKRWRTSEKPIAMRKLIFMCNKHSAAFMRAHFTFVLYRFLWHRDQPYFLFFPPFTVACSAPSRCFRVTEGPSDPSALASPISGPASSDTPFVHVLMMQHFISCVLTKQGHTSLSQMNMLLMITFMYIHHTTCMVLRRSQHEHFTGL